MNSMYLMTLVIRLFGWEVVLSSLHHQNFVNDIWTQNDGITHISVYTCPHNAMQLLCLDGNTQLGLTSISQINPHYQMKVLVDLYYAGSYENEYGLVNLDSTLISTSTYNFNTNMSHYDNQCEVGGSNNALVILTAVGTIPHTAQSAQIQISTDINQPWPTKGYCFRDVQLLIDPCHYSCQSCNGGLINNCLTCYDGATPSLGICPKCSNPNLSFQTSLSGCLQECTRSNYLADENKFCQSNNCVIIQSTSFSWAQYEIPSSFDWNLYYNGIPQNQVYFECDSLNLVGMYRRDEYITKSYILSSTTKSIRVRISYYLFNIWNQYSQVELLMNGISVSLIYMKDSKFRTINSNVISSSNGQCSNLATDRDFYYFRTEQIIKITNLNPTFTLKSSQDQWSVRDIYVDIIVCSFYCSTCLNDQNCSVCQEGYFLYKGQCISSCPEYSTISGVNCIDFDEETEYTSYLIKAFYSINSQDTETSLFNLISSAGNNFQKGNSIYFSNLKDRRIFGGALVWLNAKFGNTYSIPQPHYAVRVRMLVILGDDFANGQFQYKLHTNSVVTITRQSISTSHSQQQGDVQDEYFYQVNTLVSHTTDSFDIIVECIGDTSKAINQAFCGIANYFVTVLECQIFCTSCTSVSTCLSWSQTTANFDPTTHYCYPGYSANTVSQTCLADPVCGNGILELNEQCDDGNSIPADGCFNCQYQCSSYYPNCLNAYTNICSFGYYLNQFDNICYPECGDGIIVAEEQCEDGNILPFDGCHRCMFSCQDACSECINGNCYKCRTGFSLQNLKCQPICGNGALSGTEICEDKNLYICPENCQSCSLGVCQQCVEGFKQNKLVNKCDSVCGDKKITQFEECDDGNLVPYDGCHECQYQCQYSCLECRQGTCYRCESGWELNSQTFRCESICGDGIRVGVEVCDEISYKMDNACLNCKFECPNNCNLCNFGVCKLCDTGYQLDELINQCSFVFADKITFASDDGNLIPADGYRQYQISCQDGCLECSLGRHYLCQSNWKIEFDHFRYFCRLDCLQCDSSSGICLQDNSDVFQNSLNLQISPICGDQQIDPPEQCDDGNHIFDDGCHNCQFNCQDSCTNCVNGKCYNCQEGYRLNSISQCKPICGDNFVVGNEECDYTNQGQHENCLNCQLKCSLFCKLCSYGVCLECQPKYELDVISNKCFPNILYSEVVKEICTSTTQNECNENFMNTYLRRLNQCSIFVQGKCLKCSDGWIFDDIREICTEIIGDNLLVGSEICYVGQSQFMNQWLINFQFKDKCVECGQNCSICDNSHCLQCDVGYYVSNLNSRCESQCGDLIKTINEQCDDSSDHCQQCLIVCDIGCDVCYDNHCLLCKKAFKINIFGQCELISDKALVLIGNQLIDDEFSLLLKWECPKNCQFCSDSLCQLCEYGYYLNAYDQSCQSFCGDSIITENEECDQGLDNGDCIQCKSQCPQLFFQNQCLICIDSNCLNCNNEIGWYLNAQGFCETQCGDGIIVPTIEQCEDGNLIQYDGCFECQLDCQVVCTQCIGDICYECNTSGWYLIERRCYSLCGDKIIVSGEYCDDGNEQMYDGCFECQFQCEEKCNKCIEGICYGCIIGWEVNELNICETVCGDSVVVHPFEECDDGNQDPTDGCDQCSFQKCEEMCTLCVEGVCYECNREGWQISLNHKCEPICNDGIIKGTEQCDDNNLIPYDGCFQCKFQCHQQCLLCVKGICKKCDYGYYTYLQQCTSYCGDGKKVENEQCDDNNLENNDGCSSECQIEENWNCITEAPAISSCYELKIPKIQLSLLESNSTEIQIVSLTFDIKMQMISKYIQPQFSFRIHNQLNTSQKFVLSPIIPVNFEPQWIKYELGIYFNVSVFRPVLIVNVFNISNEQKYAINQIEAKINLRDSKVISQGEKKATQIAESFGQIVIYIMVGIAAVAVITGSLEMIWNLLDILQLLSYIKYINIPFPLNLETYFEIFKLISISPLLEILGVDAIIQKMNGGESPFVETINKFKDDQINAYFLGNFQSFLLCFFLAYTNYFGSLIMSKLVNKFSPWVIRRQNFTCLLITHKLAKFFKSNVSGFYYSAFIRIFLANYYDLMFAACIQLNNLNWDNVNMTVNSALSILTIVGQAYFILAISYKISSFTNKRTISIRNHYDSIFEGIEENNANFWGMQLNSILLLKKFLFMVVIVNFQGNGAIQTIYISMISTSYLAYIIKTKPFKLKSEFIKQIISESVISFSSLTFLIYEFRKPLQFNYSQEMMIGWIHIGLFSGILCYTMIIDFYHQILFIVNKVKAKAQLLIRHSENENHQLQLEKEKDQQQQQQQQKYTQCTMCHQYFSEFNIPLDLDCKIHKIGVCCMIFPVDCPQCYQESNKNSKINKIESFILAKHDDQLSSSSQNKFNNSQSINSNEDNPINQNFSVQQQVIPINVHIDPIN